MQKTLEFIELNQDIMKYKLRLKNTQFIVLIQPGTIQKLADWVNPKTEFVLIVNATAGFLEKKILEKNKTLAIPVTAEFRELLSEKLPGLELPSSLKELQGREIQQAILQGMPAKGVKDQVLELVKLNIWRALLLLPLGIADEVNSFAGAPDYTELSVFVQTFYTIEEREKLSAQDFFPVPMSQYRVLELTKRTRKEKLDIDEYFIFLQKIMRSKKSDVRNALEKNKLKAGKVSEDLLGEKVMLLEPAEFLGLFTRLQD